MRYASREVIYLLGGADNNPEHRLLDKTCGAEAQGATRLYPSRGGEAAAEIALRVASGGTLWWLPGELIPFRDAAYQARSVASLESGARLAWLEIITPGRLAMGERDAYRLAA